jgi:hypothetical protein
MSKTDFRMEELRRELFNTLTSPHSGIVLGVDDYRWKCAINERGKAEWIMINSPSLKKRCSNGWNAQYFDVKE